MVGIIGALCSNEKDLKRAASKRRPQYYEESVHNDQVQAYEQDGWEVARQGKRTAKMRKPKPLDVLFEDRVWMMYYDLGFWHMNADRSCKLQLDTYTKQIDVLARDESNVFVVQCRSSEKAGPLNARGALRELIGDRGDIEKAIKASWGHDCGKIHLVVAISSDTKREQDEMYVQNNKHKNLRLWSEREIMYIERLIRQVGSAAKYQLYSVIFANTKQKALKVACPAIKGKIAGYSFSGGPHS